jgi:hypothetical protein
MRASVRHSSTLSETVLMERHLMSQRMRESQLYVVGCCWGALLHGVRHNALGAVAHGECTRKDPT